MLGIDDLRNDTLIRMTDDKDGVLACDDDVLIAWDGANAGTIGYGKQGYIGSTISRLRLHDTSKFFAPFIGMFLQSNFSYLRKTATGATIPHINRNALESIQVPVFTYGDQICIATLLSKVENLISRRREQLKQLDELLKSVFLEMFGDPMINPKKFPIKLLSEFYINSKHGTKCGPFGSALKKNELLESGIAVWNMDNISSSGIMILPFRMWVSEEKFQELRAYSVINGDIIISRAGTVGKMCVAKTDGIPAIISTNLIRLRLNSLLLPLYIVSLMTYCNGRVGRLKTGADGTFTHMNTGILDILEFPYPSIELQRQFADIVEKVESIKVYYPLPERFCIKKALTYGRKVLYCNG
jgi:type I restriction enzyme S subunit